MSILKDKRMYISGPIEYDDAALNWRTEPIKVLRERFELNVFDPFQDPKQQWVKDLHQARENKDYETMVRIARSFVRKDLAMVDRSDITIVYIRTGVPSWGACHELINSNNAKKPTLLVCPDGKNKIPLWLWGFIKHEFMFGSWDDLYTYLDEVNQRKHIDNNRWAFIYGLV